MYIPLYNKSNYTLLSSLLTPDAIISYAKDNSLPYIAIADDNMFATMEFIKKCEKENIIPIIGLELYTKDFSIILYAKDYEGYKSLIKLSTIQNERVVELQDLETYNKEVIAILPFSNKDYFDTIGKIYIDSYIGYQNRQEEKEAKLITTKCLFFPKNLYVIMISGEVEVNLQKVFLFP